MPKPILVVYFSTEIPSEQIQNQLVELKSNLLAKEYHILPVRMSGLSRLIEFECLNIGDSELDLDNLLTNLQDTLDEC
jgi:hypothetical protein